MMANVPTGSLAWRAPIHDRDTRPGLSKAAMAPDCNPRWVIVLGLVSVVACLLSNGRARTWIDETSASISDPVHSSRPCLTSDDRIPARARKCLLRGDPLLYFLNSGSLPGSVIRLCGAAVLTSLRCICGFASSNFTCRESSFGRGRINWVTVALMVRVLETAQALRIKKTTSAIRRTVPSKPPPMYLVSAVVGVCGIIKACAVLASRGVAVHSFAKPARSC